MTGNASAMSLDSGGTCNTDELMDCPEGEKTVSRVGVCTVLVMDRPRVKRSLRCNSEVGNW